MKPGPRNLITDVGGLKVGNAEDRRLKSGTTVVVCGRPATASAQVLGGAGVVELFHGIDPVGGAVDRNVRVRPTAEGDLPADVLGVFVLLPVDGGAA